MLELNFSGIFNKKGDIASITDGTGADDLPLSTKYATGATNPNPAIASNIITEFVVTKPDGTQITKRYNSAITSTTPNIAATAQLPIPASALTMDWISSVLSYSSTLFPDGIFRLDVTVWMAISGTNSLNSDLINIQGSGASDFTSTKIGFGQSTLIKIFNNTTATEVTTQVASVNGATSIDLTEALSSPFEDSSELTLFAGYTTTFYIFNKSDLLKAFFPKVAKISVAEQVCCESCGHSNINDLLEVFLGIFTSESQVASGLYSEAQKNILALKEIVDELDCNGAC